MGDKLSPMDELEMVDLEAELAAEDEMRTMFDPDIAPKPPHSKEEGVTDIEGERSVDMMTDTPRVEDFVDFDLDKDDLDDLDIT